MEETVAVLVNIDTFNAVMQYLSTQPFNEVAGFIQNMGQSPGITQEHIDSMNRVTEEKAPE